MIGDGFLRARGMLSACGDRRLVAEDTVVWVVEGARRAAGVRLQVIEGALCATRVRLLGAEVMRCAIGDGGSRLGALG